MGRRTKTLLLVVTCPDGTEISGILRFGPTIAKSDHFNEAIRFPLEMFKEMARQTRPL
jgi:hypothetical protein